MSSQPATVQQFLIHSPSSNVTVCVPVTQRSVFNGAGKKNNISTIFFPLSLPRACSTLADCTFSGVFPLIYPLNALTFSGTVTAATCCSFSEKKKHITSPQCNAQGYKTHRRIQKRLGAVLSDTSPRLFRPAEYRRRSILMLIICHRSGRWSDEQNEAKNEETTTASDTNTGGGKRASLTKTSLVV